MALTKKTIFSLGQGEPIADPRFAEALQLAVAARQRQLGGGGGSDRPIGDGLARLLLEEQGRDRRELMQQRGFAAQRTSQESIAAADRDARMTEARLNLARVLGQEQGEIARRAQERAENQAIATEQRNYNRLKDKYQIGRDEVQDLLHASDRRDKKDKDLRDLLAEVMEQFDSSQKKAPGTAGPSAVSALARIQQQPGYGRPESRAALRPLRVKVRAEDEGRRAAADETAKLEHSPSTGTGPLGLGPDIRISSIPRRVEELGTEVLERGGRAMLPEFLAEGLVGEVLGRLIPPSADEIPPSLKALQGIPQPSSAELQAIRQDAAVGLPVGMADYDPSVVDPRDFATQAEYQAEIVRRLQRLQALRALRQTLEGKLDLEPTPWLR